MLQEVNATKIWDQTKAHKKKTKKQQKCKPWKKRNILQDWIFVQISYTVWECLDTNHINKTKCVSGGWYSHINNTAAGCGTNAGHWHEVTTLSLLYWKQLSPMLIISLFLQLLIKMALAALCIVCLSVSITLNLIKQCIYGAANSVESYRGGCELKEKKCFVVIWAELCCYAKSYHAM